MDLAEVQKAVAVLEAIAPAGVDKIVWRDREGVVIVGSMEVLSFYSQDLYRSQQIAFTEAVATILNAAPELVVRAARQSPSDQGGESETLKRAGGRHHPRSPDASPERVRELAGGIALNGPLDVAEATQLSPSDQGME